MKDLKIAFVYDWFDKWGGVERLLIALHDLYPQADFFTSYYDQKNASWANNFSLKTSFLQSFPDMIKKNRVLSLPFLPRAFEGFTFTAQKYDLIISVTSSFAKAIITPPEICHLCYLLTPTRFLWEDWKVYFPQASLRFLAMPYLNHLRRWDYVAASRPDYYLAISQEVAKRCKKYYRQTAAVIYPPFDLDYWTKISQNIKPLKLDFADYYLVVARLEQYKRVDFLIDYFNQHPELNLIIVGSGTQQMQLQKKAQKNIRFLGQIKDEELAWCYQNAHALIMPQKEDFGYTALEAQFFDCPVIAFAQGGALETVIDQKTGVFFPDLTFLSLDKTLASFETIAYNLKSELKKNKLLYLEKFSLKSFQDKFQHLLIQKYTDYESNNFCRGYGNSPLAVVKKKIT